MWIKRICKTGLLILLIMAVFNILPVNTAVAKTKTVMGHEIFSKKTINKRIAEIRNYYYKQPKKLTKKSAVYYDRVLGKDFKFDYYLLGKDLMFAYGLTDSDTLEYRLYFYKNQLIQILVDQKGEKRQTHTQFYDKFNTVSYDENLHFYMNMENFFRIKIAALSKKIPVTNLNDYVFITEITDTTLTYHTGTGYGSDGVIISLDNKSYTAKIDKKLKVKDGTESPGKYKSRTLDWLKVDVDGNFIPADITIKNGKVVEIELPYQA